MTTERRHMMYLADQWRNDEITRIGRYGKLNDDKDPPHVTALRKEAAKLQKRIAKFDRKSTRRAERARAKIQKEYQILRTSAIFDKPAVFFAKLKRK